MLSAGREVSVRETRAWQIAQVSSVTWFSRDVNQGFSLGNEIETTIKPNDETFTFKVIWQKPRYEGNVYEASSSLVARPSDLSSALSGCP